MGDGIDYEKVDELVDNYDIEERYAITVNAHIVAVQEKAMVNLATAILEQRDKEVQGAARMVFAGRAVDPDMPADTDYDIGVEICLGPSLDDPEEMIYKFVPLNGVAETELLTADAKDAKTLIKFAEYFEGLAKRCREEAENA